MAKRLTEIEKLARDICWAGFSDAIRREDTKARYWKTIAAEARADYVREAKYVARLVRKLGLDRVAQYISSPGV